VALGTPARDEHRPIGTDDVNPELVEYVVVVTPDVASLGTLVPALADLVADGRVHLLDLAVVVRDADGAVTVHEVETIKNLTGLREIEGDVGGLLSHQDIATAGHALPPGSAGLVILIESRWAQPLSDAARRAGGQIVGGERIPPRWVADALVQRHDDDPKRP
jgi:uncharacterized membrane protein